MGVPLAVDFATTPGAGCNERQRPIQAKSAGR